MRLLSIVIILAATAACQPTVSYKKFTANNIADNERAIFGKLETSYRSIPFERSCDIYFNYDNNLSYEIDSSGIFIGTLPVGENQISKLACKIGPRTEWYFTNFSFNVNAETEATDIGVLSFELGDPDLQESAVTSWYGEIGDTLSFSVFSKKFKDSHILNLAHRPLSEEERKAFMTTYPELDKVNNGKFVSAISFDLNAVQKSGKLPRYKTRKN